MLASSSRDALLSLRRRAWELLPTSWLSIKAARTATLSTWRYGGTVPVPRDEQWRQQWRLRKQFRSSFDSYYRYRLYDPARLADAPAFVELEEMRALRTWLYSRLPLNRDDLADKRRFHDRAVAAGLPTPPVLASVAGGQILSAPSRLPNEDLFTKEAHGMCGRGASYWVWRRDGTYASSSGREVTQGALLEHLAAQSLEAPFIVQRRLVNHPSVAVWSGAGLCTVRVMTTHPPDRPPSLLRACLRMPRGRAAADNFAQGGVAASVDLATGALGPAVQKPLSFASTSLHRHPTTGAAITGAVLPCYADVFALALRAHRAFSEFPSVGWDIAITPDGPMLVEGNYDWNIFLAQQPHGSALATTPFADDFWAHLTSRSRSTRALES